MAEKTMDVLYDGDSSMSQGSIKLEFDEYNGTELECAY